MLLKTRDGNPSVIQREADATHGRADYCAFYDDWYKKNHRNRLHTMTIANFPGLSDSRLRQEVNTNSSLVVGNFTFVNPSLAHEVDKGYVARRHWRLRLQGLGSGS